MSVLNVFVLVGLVAVSVSIIYVALFVIEFAAQIASAIS